MNSGSVRWLALVLSLVVSTGLPAYGQEPPGEISFVGKNRVATANGTFDSWRFGEVVWDGETWESARLEIVVDVASLDTNNSKRDDHLRSPDFFEVERYPEARLEIQQVRQGPSPDSMSAVMTLTLRGVTKSQPISFRVIGRDPLRVEGSLVLLRTDFGIGEPYRRFSLMSIRDEIPVTFRATIPRTAAPD